MMWQQVEQINQATGGHWQKWSLTLGKLSDVVWDFGFITRPI